MTDRDEGHREALGQPPTAAPPDADPEFAEEHEETAVDEDIITGEDDGRRETESPRGWAGEDHGTRAT
ncbi:hypothetical protein ONA91_14255 [Micromonospora sp. DR5-3]|uniref:hypothetical protein n=1 Tax=unclassified Micromonospora TaxID=2617518 RepID=UPI0011D4EDB7|nr:MULTISPECIES: hypothetical protein [unclassified Micromonospora]MCW3815619.1 hypothetical protein [Micromonospora sp. DR5-3]TYC23787.1 hypothetical protein FXF52_13270 [Micromonospora sp. MP36]